MIAVCIGIAFLIVVIVTVCTEDIAGVTDRTYHKGDQE